ncbi:MAG: type II secretion system protein GspI [SAR86 cluster bacterium]|jgi:type II secretion system protein I|uniref:Type II secretion system protein I n=1 Tax=SAR86 cluster bacterium TaxID=2030880 RepID=A0A520N0S4_9GAMM|nr:MAG: type II secretion system protein GspI [SAR86 cluster bacterium]|tara:strand:+ start:221 stop:604 length:384 start_codon:yes stop_codon:yes gene_type:complete
MEKLRMKLSVIKKGFSLIEVVVALFILSVSVITIYNLIISTSVSSYDLEQRYLAKEVANNHIALLNTIEKPLRSGNRKGEMIMGGQNWVWDEEIYDTSNEDYFEYEVRIKLAGQDKYIYSTKGYLIK